MTYIESIKTAVFIFPFVSFLFTIPFILHQYHKYGSINAFRVLIVYSFILYMMCIYFLVILPLPEKSTVTAKMGEMMNLRPFAFVNDIIRESSFVLNNPNTYLKSLMEPCIYTVLLNIVMTVPFGMYLRYYFECSFKKTVLLSFGLSLFFELTQLSGLYFIYPGPYRLFDVDDLIMNTLGGVLGYSLMGFGRNILPSRREIDRESLRDGTKVSSLRRFTAFALDVFIYGAISVFFRHDNSYKIVFIIYFIVIPPMLNDQTLGEKFLNIKLDYHKYKIPTAVLRVLFIYTYYFGLPTLGLTIAKMSIVEFGLEFASGYIYLAAYFLILLFWFVNFLSLLINKRMFYDDIFKVNFESTIYFEEEDEEI